MIKQLFLSFACLAVSSVYAQKSPVWLDPEVNQVNREVRHAHFFAFENEELARQKGENEVCPLSLDGGAVEVLFRERPSECAKGLLQP